MAFSYRLYGDLYLDDPAQHLDKQCLERLRALEPHFRNLENCSRDGTELDYKDAFAKFADQESILWQPPRRRDEIVPPSGQYQSRLAHHLHNPSFHTLTPHNGETADETNFCIYLVMQNGFVKGHTFIFDHLARREIVDGIRKYPPHILQCHEEFTAHLRSNMHAEVEVVWGKIVRVRMLELYHKNGNRLEPLRLWGAYKDVTVFLEWDKSIENSTERLVRFIIFVMHPQVFLTGSWFKFAPLQDLYLSVAGKLSRTAMADNYFQSNPQRHRSFFVSKAAYSQAESLGQIALNAVLTSSEELKKGDKTMGQLQQMEATVSPFLPEQSHNTQSTHKGSRPMSPRPIKQPVFNPPLVQQHQGDHVVTPSLGIRESTRLSTNDLKDLLCLSIRTIAHEVFLMWDETGDIEFLPDYTRRWMKDQSNDWLDGKNITSLSDLQSVHKHYTRQAFPELTPRTLVFDLMSLHLQRLVHIDKRFKIDNDAFTPVFGPRSVMRVECSCCGSSFPHDEHPRYVVRNPDRYIARESRCTTVKSKDTSKDPNYRRVHAVPVNKAIAYVLPNEGSRHSRISKDVSTRGSRMQLVRAQRDCYRLPKCVLVHCIACSNDAGPHSSDRGTNERLDQVPQWTTANPPRYVTRRMMCGSCGKQTLFFPCIARIPAVTKKILADLERGYPGMSIAELTAILSSRWPTPPWTKSVMTSTSENVDLANRDIAMQY